jgi:hypothetical protein
MSATGTRHARRYAKRDLKATLPTFQQVRSADGAAGELNPRAPVARLEGIAAPAYNPKAVGRGATRRMPRETTTTGVSGAPRRAFALPVLTLAIGALLLITGAERAGADAAYEPNDTLQTATGPLAPDSSYSAVIESRNDRDIYSFFVTSRAEASVTVSLINRGGGPGLSDVDARLLDITDTPITASALSYVQDGEAQSMTVSLPPGKYFVEVNSSIGYGDGYELLTGGGSGAFGSYGRIAHLCASASAAVKSGEGALDHAKTKLQRATNRLRRARYSRPPVRREARDLFWKAKRAVRSKRRKLRQARASQSPWCSIPR